MKQRCGNPKCAQYAYYGGKGISYDPRWADFRVFLEEMGERPEGMVLSRRDNALGFFKGNCVWLTHGEALAKRADAIEIAVTLPAGEWARLMGLPVKVIHARLKRGWTPAQAVGHDLHQDVFKRGPKPREL